MARKKKFNFNAAKKRVTSKAPAVAGALVANYSGGMIDGWIPSDDKKITGGIQVLVGVGLMGFVDNAFVDGFATVLAARGAGKVINGFMPEDKQVPGLGGTYEQYHRIYRNNGAQPNGKAAVTIYQ